MAGFYIENMGDGLARFFPGQEKLSCEIVGNIHSEGIDSGK